MLGRVRRIAPNRDASSSPLAARGGGREPVLPTVIRAPRQSSAGHPAAKRRHSTWRRTALAALLVLAAGALAAFIAAATVSAYAFSIIWEPPGAVAAAAADAQAAAARYLATQQGSVDNSMFGAVSADDKARFPASNDTVAAASRYTIVVMSYNRRLSILPLIINKLGSCPSVAEVLLVWNGDDPPSLDILDSPAPVRIRTEHKNNLNNRMKLDPGYKTDAVFIADDDVLFRCADLERAFARWQDNRQALVGFFPRLAVVGPPSDYLHERIVFQRGQYNVMLTAGEFVSRQLLERYWSKQYNEGRELVARLTNCEDILLTCVAAGALLETQQQQQQQQKELGSKGSREQQRRRGHVSWMQPSRRLDISFLSGVGISKGHGVHIAMRRQCVAQFSEWYGADLLQTQQVDWKADGRGGWLSRPMCRLTSLGCVYL